MLREIAEMLGPFAIKVLAAAAVIAVFVPLIAALVALSTV
jgi:hypothetical protein